MSNPRCRKGHLNLGPFPGVRLWRRIKARHRRRKDLKAYETHNVTSLPYCVPLSSKQRNRKPVPRGEYGPQNSALFSRLPLEVRQQIYDYVIAPTQLVQNQWNGSSTSNKCIIEWEPRNVERKRMFRSKLSTGIIGHYVDFHRATSLMDLLLVSRQVYVEFSKHLYSSTTFVFTARDAREPSLDAAHAFDAFASIIPPDRLPLIPSFRITYVPLPYTLRDSKRWAAAQKLAAWKTMWTYLEQQRHIKVIEVVVPYLKGGPEILDPLLDMDFSHLDRFDIFFYDSGDYESYITYIDKHVPAAKSAPRPFSRHPPHDSQTQLQEVTFRSRDSSHVVDAKTMATRMGVPGFRKTFPFNGIHVATGKSEASFAAPKVVKDTQQEGQIVQQWASAEFLLDIRRFKDGDFPSRMCCEREHSFQFDNSIPSDDLRTTLIA